MAALEIVEKEVIARIGVLRSSDRRLWSLTLEVAVCGDCHADAAERKISNAVERKVFAIVQGSVLGSCFVAEQSVPIPTKPARREFFSNFALLYIKPHWSCEQAALLSCCRALREEEDVGV